ncbi:MAG: Signal peptidase-like protein [Gemmatimonadota bacterium]|nr:MAG: Signal peptidase-like protein [Gemmatimonadota bacterium]
MAELIEVRFKGNRKGFFSWDQESQLEVGTPVVVDVERGQDLGHVTAIGDIAVRKCSGCNGCDSAGSQDPRGAVVRLADADDTHLIDELRKAEEDVRRTVVERVETHGLLMKVTDAEWQWDRKKLTVYFTAEKRVDFRALVRDLAALFRTRIELRQIGARDEAKRLDGLGRCGRQYCCAAWLTELKPVSLSLAKDQRLSLNPSQISGGCGRLLCCLRYEHDFYVSSRRRFPKEGRAVRTASGTQTIMAVDIFRERILLRSEDGTTRSATLAELKRDVAAADGTKERPPQPPSALVTFEEAHPEVTAESAAEAVTPRKRRRKRRGRRRGRGGRKRPDKGPAGPGTTTGEDGGG